MRFFETLYRSISDLVWLKLNRANHKTAWRYFATLVALLSVLWLIPDIFFVPRGIKEVRNTVVQNIPEFQATLKSGTLTVNNLQQPYVLRDGDLVFVVDTMSTETPKLSTYLNNGVTSGMLVTKKSVEIYDGDSGQSKSQDFSNIPDAIFTRTDLVNRVNQFSGTGMIVLIMVLLVIGTYVFLFIGKLASIVIVALLVKLIAALGRKQWMYTELFTVGLFAVTLPSFISLIAGWTGMYIPYIHSLALLAFMLAVVFTKDGVETVVDSTKS